MFSYGNLFVNGVGVPKSLEKAAFYYQKAAQGGDIKGIFCYAKSLKDGAGIGVDLGKALRHFAYGTEFGRWDHDNGKKSSKINLQTSCGNEFQSCLQKLVENGGKKQ